MEFKFHQHKFTNMNRYYDIIREAMLELGHKENDVEPDIHFYNHISIWPREDKKIIVKPTAPTSFMDFISVIISPFISTVMAP